MPILLFTLNPAAVSQIHDILTCLAKFNEDVSIEATTSELRISSLNTSKTAHAAFSLSGSQFFDKYHFSPDQKGTAATRSWACKLQNRALSSVFFRRNFSAKENEALLERCEFELQARADQPECRLVFRLVCRSGMVKTYRLTYETGEILHATFDRASSPNTWTVSAKTLRDVVEYFGPKTEQLDWYLQEGKVTFTSYTDKIQNGREILKQPMHTSVALERRDFNECRLEEGLHIGIVVKDFRAIVSHAESLQADITARYLRGNRPMQISYTHNGMHSEFTLMTRGSTNIPSGSSATPVRDLPVRPIVQSQTPHQTSTVPSARNTSMAPPEPRGALKRQLSGNDGSGRAQSPPPPTASINPDSLFIPADDDDQQWDEPSYEDDTDIVTWDDAAEPPDLPASMRSKPDSAPTSFVTARNRQYDNISEIAPTQRLSQVKGMFD